MGLTALSCTALSLYPLLVMLVNRTIDDSSLDKITYAPSSSWIQCPADCLGNAELAFEHTIHFGLHAAHHNILDSKGDDSNVMASLNFTGSAFYVYCILPVQNDKAPMSTTNLTILLDGVNIGSFFHDPRINGEEDNNNLYHFPVFFKKDLHQTQHTLDIKLEKGSGVFLDYVEYSTLETDVSTQGPAALAPSLALLQQRSSGGGVHRNEDGLKFGVALGLTAGVLAVVAFGVFISIYRRRRKSEQRGAAHDPGSEVGFSDAFVPRYFPGTVIPPSPPALSPSPPIRVNDDAEDMGPSHGLNLPLAPEHIGSQKSVPSLISPRLYTGSQSLRSTNPEDEPSLYYDSGRSAPTTYPPPPPPPPPGLAYPYFQPYTSSESLPAPTGCHSAPLQKPDHDTPCSRTSETGQQRT